MRRQLAAAAVAGAVFVGSGVAAAPPVPAAANGAAVTVVGAGVPTPTAFAFHKGQVFVSGFGRENGKTPGAIYVLRDGAAIRIPGSAGASGIAWKGGTLYASVAPSGRELVAYSGWNGARFAGRRTVWRAPRRFTGLNGIAIGWDGRIYAGVSLTDAGDHKRVDIPFAQSVISMTTDGTHLKTIATGLRQPWQLAFVKHMARPFVTVLGQENLGRKQPPDYVIQARDGQDYGFPQCNWSKPAACASYPKPVALFPAHSSPTGITVGRGKLYIALFNGRGHGPEVVTLPVQGGAAMSVLTGFPAPVVAVGYDGRSLFVGDLTGSIYHARV